jgi:hypothetical protein
MIHPRPLLPPHRRRARASFWRPLLAATMLSTACAFAQSIGASFPAAWSGAAGSSGALLVPAAGRSPVSLFEQGLAGRLRVLYTAPGGKSPQGAYSGTLTLYDNGSVLTVRGSGVPAADGSIDATWTSSGKSPASVQVRLSRLVTDPQAMLLQGTATVGPRQYPIFLLPESYGKSAPFAGDDSVPGPGNSSFFLVDFLRATGSTTGSVVVDAAGVAKFTGILSDGAKFTATAPVLVGGGRTFLAVAGPAGKGGFLGAWAHADRSQADSDWHGKGLVATGPQRVADELDFRLAGVTAPAAGTSPLPWSKATLHLEFEPYFFVANGTITFDGRSRFTADPEKSGDNARFLNGANGSGVRLNSLSLDARKGLVKGQMTHFSDGQVLAINLNGAVNPKSGVIEGRIAPRSAGQNSGFFDIIPLP